MEDFPDPDDEYDLMHEDEYEVLRELENEEKQKNASQKQNNVYASEQNYNSQQVVTQNFSQQNNNSQQFVTKNLSQQNNNSQQVVTQNFSQEKNFNASQQNNNNQQVVTATVEQQFHKSQESAVVENGFSQLKTSLENTKKRSVNEICQIDSLLNLDLDAIDDLDDYEAPKSKKPCWDHPEELIQLILDRRKMIHNNDVKSNFEYKPKDRKDSISRRVPTWNFIAVTRTDDGERFYIKVCDKNKYVPNNIRPTSKFLSKSFSQLKTEAEQIIANTIERARNSSMEVSVNNENLSCELWVDKYRPKRYLELLSDEHVNRSLLYWLKLWDKIVFDRDPTVRARKAPQSKFKNKFKKKEDIPDHDSKGFPTQRLALLTGPPGLGKTTLAHVAARHAGYNIVEVNASDDRGPEAFREALLASTQMRSVIDKEKRPNCLILDEIDGAPAASIDLLLKFIHGKLAPKGKNVKAKENDGCRRPIICVCNDPYTPSLRPLRAMALVINVPEISASTLAERLSEIARKEGLQVDSRLLLQLAERSACDVRACLGILQYTGGKANMLKNLAFGLKDMRKGLFDCWKELLQVPMTRQGVLTNSERAQKVIRIVQQGESDRLAQGIFHNYPEICKEKIINVSMSMKWFEFYDEINTLILERQSWMLMPYTTSAFVAWHLYLASGQNPKISYPSALFEVNQKSERNKAILTVTKKTSKIDMATLVTDVLPLLPELLCPKLRSVNATLYSTKEKQELERLVNLMLDFGLTFTQERKQEGGYEYYLDPNILSIGTFPDCKVRKPLPYAVKQIIIQELETARLQRAAIMNDEMNKKTSGSKAQTTKSTPASSNKKDAEPTPSQSSSQSCDNVPNHLRTLNPVELKPNVEKKCRNFFAAFQLAGQEKLKERRAKEKEQGIVHKETTSPEQLKKAEFQRKKKLLKNDVWYQYNEGYSNAVRRTVLMKDLL